MRAENLLRQDNPLRFEIDYLARHERHLPLIAEWQMAEFGHLAPADTLADRMTRLARALQPRPFRWRWSRCRRRVTRSERQACRPRP